MHRMFCDEGVTDTDRWHVTTADGWATCIMFQWKRFRSQYSILSLYAHTRTVNHHATSHAGGVLSKINKLHIAHLTCGCEEMDEGDTTHTTAGGRLMRPTLHT